MIKNWMKSVGLAASALAMSALSASAQADDRVLWLSIGDGIGSSSNLDAAITFAENNNFNAISILARYRADLYFTPNRDFSTYTNNEPMRTTGGFDAVQYVIDRAKESDIRVYAAFSCFIVSDGGSSSFPTITGLNSDWIQEVYQGATSTYTPDPGFPRDMLASEGEGFWIDPGIPAARDYTKDVILDFVENYDIDGIILDRVRYPGDAFTRGNESFGYTPLALAEYGLGNPAPDSAAFIEARRDAVSDFVEELQADVHALKPWVIYGATPITALASDQDTLDFVYQDYIEWDDRTVSTSIHPSGLGLLDVIMPQFYRADPADNDTLIGVFEPNLTNIPHSPVLAAFSGSVTGAELAENICDIDTAGLDGYGLFAYTDTASKIAAINSASPACGTNIISGDGTGNTEYTNKAGWDSTPPGAVASVTATPQSDGTVDLSWPAATDAATYLVFRDTDSTVEPYYENLVDPAATITGTSFTDTTAAENLAVGNIATYYYSVIPVDDFNNRGTGATSSSTLVSPTTYFVESRDFSGAQTSSPTFTTSAAFSTTSAKSGNATLGGSGSLFTTTTGLSASFSPQITDSGLYRVYYIMDGGGSNSNAVANADFTISTNAEPSDQTGDVDLVYTVTEFVNDEFLEITTTPVEVNTGAAGSAITLTLTFTTDDPVLGETRNRFVVDSSAFVKVGELTGDTTPPQLQTVVSLSGVATNASTASFTFNFTEDVQNFDDFGTDISVSGVTTSGGSITSVDASTYTVEVTGISSEGTLMVDIAGGSDVQDLAGNSLGGSPPTGQILVDTTAPTPTASVTEDYQVTGNIAVDASNLTDSGTAITSDLYYRVNGGTWTLDASGISTPNTFIPGASGLYEFYVAATDQAGNEKAVPTGGTSGDDLIFWSSIADDFTYTPSAGQTNVIFPMTNADAVTMDFSSASGISAIQVQRVTGDNAPAGFDSTRLIDEYLDITGSFTGTISMNWDGWSTAGNSGSTATVYRDDSGSVTTINSGDVTYGANDVTINNISGFSDWYLGDASATIDDWMILEE